MSSPADSFEIRAFGCTARELEEAVVQRLAQFSSSKAYVEHLLAGASQMLANGTYDSMAVMDAIQQINRARWVLARHV